MEEKQYTKYFNYGYFLSKHEPKILKSLLHVTKDTADIHEPLSAGKSQYTKENVRERLKNQKLPDRSGRDLDKGFEPEL